MTLRSLPPTSSTGFVPPLFLPLALHLLGAGTIIMAASLAGVVALLVGAPLTMTTWTGTAMLTGQALVLLGLFLAGRTSPGSMRHWFARVATALWGTALALDVSRGDLRRWLSEHFPSAERMPQLTGWVAWCGALVLLVVMLRPTFREVGRRAWPLAVGATLVGLQGGVLAWLLFVRPDVAALASSVALRLLRVVPGALGLLLSGTAIFVLARVLQPMVIVDRTDSADAAPAPKKRGRARARNPRRR